MKILIIVLVLLASFNAFSASMIQQSDFPEHIAKGLKIDKTSLQLIEKQLTNNESLSINFHCQKIIKKKKYLDSVIECLPYNIKKSNKN